MADSNEAPTNGRVRQKQASRQRTVHAALELLAEGNIRPTADQIAERAGLGRRTVFRHFEVMEDLYQELVIELNKRYTLLTEPFQSTQWREQLFELMHRRLTIYERFLPFKLAGDVYRSSSHILQASHLHRRSVMRTNLENILPPAVLKNRTLLNVIDLTLSFDAWQRLRIEQSLSLNDAGEAIELLLTRLLSDEAGGATLSLLDLPTEGLVPPDHPRGHVM
jgi:AcrR family transcriptional regulator